MSNDIPGSRPQPPGLGQLWQTINPAHAIQRAVVTLSFSEQISSLVVTRILNAVRPVAREIGLVKEAPLNTSMIQIGPSGVQHTPPATQTGVSLQDVRGEQVAHAFNVTRDALVFETNAYTRWAAFIEFIEILIKPSLPIIADVVTLHSVGVEYFDFFFAVNEGAEDVGLIIENQSQLIPKRAFRRRMPFHSHSGWFEREAADGRRLVNVDVTVADGVGPFGVRRTVTIRTFEAEQIPDANSPRATTLAHVPLVIEVLGDLHRSLKGRLAHLLTREAKSMISLGS